MCEDSQKSFSTSLVMYTIMADSIAKTIKDVLDESKWCNPHKAVNLSFLIHIATPVVDAIKLYGDIVNDDTIMHEAVDSLSTLLEVGIEAKDLLVQCDEDIKNNPMLKLLSDFLEEGQQEEEQEQEEEEAKLKDLEEGLDKLMGGGLHGG